MNKTLSVGIACGFGSIIGALVGIDLLSGIMPQGIAGILGMVVGGIVGWVTIDFRQLCAGTKYALKKAINWRLDRRYLRAVARGVPSYITVTFTIGLAIWSFFSILIGSPIPFSRQAIESPIEIVWGMIWGACFSDLLILIMLPVVLSENALRAFPKGGILRPVLLFNPIGIIVGLLWQILTKILPQVGNGIRKGSAVCARFLRTLFIQVHSQRRTICFVDAAIGAGVGFYFGSALIGGIDEVDAADFFFHLGYPR